MTIDTLAAPLAAALSAKGYDSLTSVQNAVLAEDLAGRDLLVSAQTGSGKTVAFGLAIAPELLGADDGGLGYAPAPRALIVAPTRELALQVRREFEWLYAGTGAVVASCVGGMDYRTEKRALERGAAIVVGTPGRLRDHIERGSLDLSVLRAAVLDEADEMLDLGFREDLEFILGAAPADRRTLMFSATVPRAIEELARDFQRDAARVIAGGESRQHVDIEYRAVSVAVRDRENAILNLLRLQEARVAIVFCKTRANVNHLMARMANRGFAVVALSGELSQQERTHALQALRDGRARVCIATDVAARGIDLPGLDLVVHADLPSNSETLLHRSGRTGRAGAKGVSVLVVTPADFRKAQRLLQGAKVVADWGKPPSADEVRAADDERLLGHEVFAEPVAEDEAAMVAALLEAQGPEGVATGLLRLFRAGRSAPEELHDVAVPGDAPRRERPAFGPSVWFSVSVGHTGRAEARWLLPKICDAGGISKDGIGAIRVQENRTYVQIGEDVAGRFPPLGQELVLEEGVVLSRMAGEPVLDRPERAPRAAGPRDAGARPDRGPRPDRADRPARDDARPAPRSFRPDREDRPARAPAPVPRAVGLVDSAAPRPQRAAPDAVQRAEPAAEAPARKPRAPRSEGYKSHAARDTGDGFKPKRAPRAEPAEADSRPYRPRAAETDRKPRAVGKDGPRKPPYEPRGDNPRAAGGDKPYAPRGDKKPYAPRDGAARPARAPRSVGADARPSRAPVAKAAAPKPDFSDPGLSLRARPRAGAKPGGKPGPKGKPGPRARG